MHNLIFAYLDPGTGSFIIQMLIAFLVGVSFFIKSIWRRFKIFVTNLFHKSEPE